MGAVFTVSLRGKGTPHQNLACFVRYRKIINTLLKTVYAVYTGGYSKLCTKLKNDIKNWGKLGTVLVIYHNDILPILINI